MLELETGMEAPSSTVAALVVRCSGLSPRSASLEELGTQRLQKGMPMTGAD